MLDGLDRILPPTSNIACATRFTELIKVCGNFLPSCFAVAWELSNDKDLVPI
jgi:hypothetical protein